MLVNKEDRYLDLINNSNSQLVWSISFNRDNNSKDQLKRLKWKLFNSNNNFSGILFESLNIKIFDSERVYADIEASELEEFLDFYVDGNEENLFVLSIVGGYNLEVKQYNLANQLITAKSKRVLVSKEVAVEAKNSKHLFIISLDGIRIREGYILKDYAILITDDNNYLYLNYNKKDSVIINGSVDMQLDSKTTVNIKKFENINTIVFNNYGSSNLSSLKILSLEKNSLKTVNIDIIEKEQYFADYVDDSQASSIYLFKKKNANTYILNQVDLLDTNYSLKEITSHTINEEINIISFIINPYDQSNFILITKENRIYSMNKSNNSYQWKNDQSLTNLQFSELITYFKEEADEKIHSYNDLNSIFRTKEFTRVFLNIFNNLLTDLSVISSRIKNNLQNLTSLNKDTKINTITNNDQKVYQNLILFTRESEELYVIDALTGEIKLIKQFRNKILHKIVKSLNDSHKNNDKFVYIIFKDKSSDFNLSSYKLNLETKELTEDKDVIDSVKLEQELSIQSENLIKNESDGNSASFNVDSTLVVNNDSEIFNRMINKYKIKTTNKGLYGLKVNKQKKVNIAWSINMKPFSIQYPNVHKNVITTYHSAGKVFYKYIDSNLMLTLTNLANKTLVVSVIRTTNGKVLHQSSISNVDFSQKIFSVFEENIILISYMKKEKNVRRNEIHAIEIMKREIEHSLLQMLEKLFKINLFNGNVDTDQDLLNEVQESDLVFLSHTYVTPRKVKGLYATKTLLNVENKYFVFLFENNQAFLVDKRGVSPRRPLAKEDKSKPGTNILDPMNSPYIDPELTPYNPLMAFDFKQVLNVDFFVNQIDNILISPTLFESTFLLCTEGSSLTCYKVSPDKTFDALSPSFSYAQIALFLSLALSIAFMLRRFVKKNEFKNIFINTT